MSDSESPHEEQPTSSAPGGLARDNAAAARGAALDGATTALHRRIEELTAELERSRIDAGLAHAAAKQEHGPCFAQIESWKEMHATERAAREKAEADRDQAIADEKSEIALRTEQEALVSRLIVEKRQAERERDTALARVKELEMMLSGYAERKGLKP